MDDGSKHNPPDPYLESKTVYINLCNEIFKRLNNKFPQHIETTTELCSYSINFLKTMDIFYEKGKTAHGKILGIGTELDSTLYKAIISMKNIGINIASLNPEEDVTSNQYKKIKSLLEEHNNNMLSTVNNIYDSSAENVRGITNRERDIGAGNVYHRH